MSGYGYRGWDNYTDRGGPMLARDWNILTNIWIKLGYSYIPFPFIEVVKENLRMCSEKNMEALGLKDTTDER